jgi:hypothetical protein
MGIKMTPALEEKIIRRSRRAFRYHRKGSDKKFPRITDVTRNSLMYRVPNYPDAGPHSDSGDWAGTKKVEVLRHEGEITLNIPPRDPVLDLLVKGDLDRLKNHDGMVRAYKYTDKDAQSPTQTPKITYTVGKTVKVDHADEDPTNGCAAGINLATLDWVAAYVGKNDNRIFAVEFDSDDLAAIPDCMSGKFRVKECYVVEELDKTKLGWNAPVTPPTPKGGPAMGPIIKHVPGDPLTANPADRMKARKEELERRRKKDVPPLNIDPKPNERPMLPAIVPDENSDAPYDTIVQPEEPKSHIRRIEPKEKGFWNKLKKFFS